MTDKFSMDDYIDVAQRIHDFYDRFPDGRLVTVDWEVVHIGDRDFMLCHAKAFRTPEDPLPGDGLAWEPVPGPTQFTKDSELMNAQTAAWGRAIVALGFDTKKIASKQEVRARQNGVSTHHTGATPPHPESQARADAVQPSQMVVTFGKHKGKQVRDVPTSYWEWWLGQDGNKNPELLAAVELHLGLTAQPAGVGDDIDEIPF